MAENAVLIERSEGVATVTINRPDAFNALNTAVLEDLFSAVQRLAAEGMRAIVLTGTGERAFSAGADLNELSDLDADAAFDLLVRGQRTMDAIAGSPVPVIAAVNGLALGGGFELVLSCTFAVLSNNASLGLPESGLGLIPGYGGTQRLPLAIGRPAAAHVMLTGDRLSAQRAYELGLSPVPPVDLGDLALRAREIAETIASKGPRAQAAIMTALRTSAATSDGLTLEASLAGAAIAGTEAAEGMSAFHDKRRPDFTTPKGRGR